MRGDSIIEATEAMELNVGGTQKHRTHIAQHRGFFGVLLNDCWNWLMTGR